MILSSRILLASTSSSDSCEYSLLTWSSNYISSSSLQFFSFQYDEKLSIDCYPPNKVASSRRTAASICSSFILSLKYINKASQNFSPNSQKWRTVKWMFSYSGPQKELSRAQMSQCLSSLAKKVLLVPYYSSFSRKEQSLKEKPLKILLIRRGNYFPFLGLELSWQPYTNMFFFMEWPCRSQNKTTSPISWMFRISFLRQKISGW